MMSTVHDVANQPPLSRPIYLRPTASTHLATEAPNGEIYIPYHQISFDYNREINGSDVSQQIWNKYPVGKHPHRRNWWPLFWHLVAASIANVLYIYKLKGHKISHLEIQQRISLQLLRNPPATTRKRPSNITPAFTRPSLLRRPLGEHKWTRLSKRYCIVCKKPPRIRGIGRKTRAALQEMGTNECTQLAKTSRKRTKQTTWGCADCQVALCRNSWCWQRHHSDVQGDGDGDSDVQGDSEACEADIV